MLDQRLGYRRWRIALGAVTGLALVLAGLAVSQGASVPRTFAQSVAVSDTATTLTFGFDATLLVLVNDGPSTVYLEFGPGATTSDFALRSGENATLGLLTRAGELSLICAAGQTATVRVWAVQ